MTRRPVRNLLACVATLAAVAVGAAAPAAADTENHRDPRGDVARIDTGRPGFAGIDILSVHNRFSHGKLVVSTRLADEAERYWSLSIVVMTDDGSHYRGSARVGNGEHFVFGGASPHYGHGCRETDRFEHHTLTFIYTRACYRGVSWVRVASFATRRADGDVVFRDDAHRGPLRSGNRLRFGPRLDYTA